MPNLVLTVIADDRPGLVAALSDTIADHGGSWQESQMARLAGTFAGIVLVSVESDRADELRTSVQQLTEAGVVQATMTPAERSPDASGHVSRLRLTGQDHPGIVRDISRVLAGHDVTIEELHSSTSAAPMTGGTLFQADLVVRMPAGADRESVRSRLEEIADEIMVEVKLDDDSDDGAEWGVLPAGE